MLFERSSTPTPFFCSASHFSFWSLRRARWMRNWTKREKKKKTTTITYGRKLYGTIVQKVHKRGSPLLCTLECVRYAHKSNYLDHSQNSQMIQIFEQLWHSIRVECDFMRTCAKFHKFPLDGFKGSPFGWTWWVLGMSWSKILIA